MVDFIESYMKLMNEKIGAIEIVAIVIVFLLASGYAGCSLYEHKQGNGEFAEKRIVAFAMVLGTIFTFTAGFSLAWSAYTSSAVFVPDGSLIVDAQALSSASLVELCGKVLAVFVALCIFYGLLIYAGRAGYFFGKRAYYSKK